MSAAAEHLVGQVIAAHGGLDRWSQVQTLTVRFSAGGLLFRLKGRTHGLENATVRFVRGHQLGTAASAGPRPWQLDIGAPDQLRRASPRGDGPRRRNGTVRVRHDHAGRDIVRRPRDHSPVDVPHGLGSLEVLGSSDGLASDSGDDLDSF